MTKIFFSTLQRKVAALLFRNGFRLGYTMLYSDLVQSAQFIRQQTSPTFAALCQDVVLKSAWNKRRQLQSYEGIKDHTMRWSTVLADREVDRQTFLGQSLAFHWNMHNSGSYRVEPVPEFILMLARKYDVAEISKQIQIAANLAEILMRASFNKIWSSHSDDQEFSELWDQLTIALLGLSSEQAL